MTLLILGATPAPAQYVMRVERPEGLVGFEFDAYDRYAASGLTDAQQTLREYLSLQFGGSMVDPRVLKFDIGLRPRFEQTSWNATNESARGGLVNLDSRFGLHLFSRGKISLQANATRVSNDVQTRGDEERDLRYRDVRVRLNTKFRPLPAWIEYRSLHNTVDLIRPYGLDLFRDESSRLLYLQARNSKIFFEYQHIDFEDRIEDKSITTDRMTGTHSFVWGKGSRLRTLVSHIDRAGFAPFRRFYWNEFVHLQHTGDAHTDLRLRLFDQTSRGSPSRGWFVQAQPWFRISDLFQASLVGRAEKQRLEFADYRRYEIQPRSDLSLPLPGGLRLTASGSVGYRWQEQTSQDEPVGDVFEERHSVDEFGVFTLDESFAIPGSILITSEDASILFQEGVDYRVLQQGLRTEIIALPDGRIQPRDVVLVSYRFRLLGELSANALLADYSVRLQAGKFALFNYLNLVSPTTAGGVEGVIFSGAHENVGVGASYQAPTSFGPVNIRAEYGSSSSGGRRFEMFTLRGGLSSRLSSNLSGNLGTAWQKGRQDSQVPVSRLDASVGINWHLLPRLNLLGSLLLRRSRRADDRETFFGVGLGGEWTMRKLRLFLRYDYRSWRAGTSEMENRIRTGVARSF